MLEVNRANEKKHTYHSQLIFLASGVNPPRLKGWRHLIKKPRRVSNFQEKWLIDKNASTNTHTSAKQLSRLTILIPSQVHVTCFCLLRNYNSLFLPSLLSSLCLPLSSYYYFFKAVSLFLLKLFRKSFYSYFLSFSWIFLSVSSSFSFFSSSWVSFPPCTASYLFFFPFLLSDIHFIHFTK